MAFGENGTATEVSASNPLPVGDGGSTLSVDDGGGALTVDGTVAVTDGGSTISVDDGAGSLTVDGTVAVSGEPTVKVNSALPAGTNAIGKLAANSGVDIGDVDVTSISAGSNKIGDVGIGTRTSGGCSVNKNLDVDESEDAVKESAGQVYGYFFANLATATRYLKFYNATPANVTVGTTEPVMTFPLPKESSGHISFACPIAFSTAITIAATTGLADNNTGAPGANEIVTNVLYA